MDDSTMAAFLDAFTNQPDSELIDYSQPLFSSNASSSSNSNTFDRRASLASSFGFQSNSISNSNNSPTFSNSSATRFSHLSAAPSLSIGGNSISGSSKSSTSGHSPASLYSAGLSPNSQEYYNEDFLKDLVAIGASGGGGGQMKGQQQNFQDMNVIKPQYLFGQPPIHQQHQQSLFHPSLPQAQMNYPQQQQSQVMDNTTYNNTAQFQNSSSLDDASLNLQQRIAAMNQIQSNAQAQVQMQQQQAQMMMQMQMQNQNGTGGGGGSRKRGNTMLNGSGSTSGNENGNGLFKVEEQEEGGNLYLDAASGMGMGMSSLGRNGGGEGQDPFPLQQQQHFGSQFSNLQQYQSSTATVRYPQQKSNSTQQNLQISPDMLHMYPVSHQGVGLQGQLPSSASFSTPSTASSGMQNISQPQQYQMENSNFMLAQQQLQLQQQQLQQQQAQETNGSSRPLAKGRKPSAPRKVSPNNQTTMAPAEKPLAAQVKSESTSSDGLSPPPITTTTTTQTAQPPAPDKLHNKVEQRYRSNVRDALEMLRDSVPRLRNIFGTSTPEQLATTDREDSNGLMGGIKQFNKPTKKTIMVVARLYIEHLERQDALQSDRLARSDSKLREYMLPQQYEAWLIGELTRTGMIEQQMVQMAEAKEARSDDGGDGGEEEEEEDERPKKRVRNGQTKGEETSGKIGAGKKINAGAKKQKGGSIAGAGAIIMSSFGMAYTFFPRATTMLPASGSFPDPSSSSPQQQAGRVLVSAPYKAANKSATILAQALPAHRVPHPDDLLDWALLVFLALGLTWISWYLLERYVLPQEVDETKPEAIEVLVRGEEEVVDKALEAGSAGIATLKKVVGCGSMGGLMRDGAGGALVKIGMGSKGNLTSLNKAWLGLVSADLGGVIELSTMEKLHASCFFARSPPVDAFGIALLALCAEEDNSAADQWMKAKKTLEFEEIKDKALELALSLPFDEAKAILERMDPVLQPIGAIADQAALKQLAEVATKALGALVANVKCRSGSEPSLVLDISQLREGLRTVPEQVQCIVQYAAKGSEACALGLSLLGLAGSITGTLDTDAQKRLLSVLISEDLALSQGGIMSLTLAIGLLAPTYPHRSDLNGSITERAENLDTMISTSFKLMKAVGQSTIASKTGKETDRAAAAKTVVDLRVLLGRGCFRVDSEKMDKEGLMDKADSLVDTLTKYARRSSPDSQDLYDSGLESDVSEGEKQII